MYVIKEALVFILLALLLAACGGSNSKPPGVAALDTIPPTPPQNVVVEAVSTAEVRLIWGGSSDDIGITGYNLYRDGELIITTSQLDFVDTALESGTTYHYSVSALDAAGNESELSADVTATTLENSGIVSSTHYEIPPDGFAGSIDFADAIIQANTTGKTHTITLNRYHGSKGVVSIDYESFGDSHTNVSGTVFWADGEIGAKSFTVSIPAQEQHGEHRVYLELSNPAGGVRLGRDEYSRMYIITDDGSEAINAIWVDAENGSDTNEGTKDQPMQTISAAIQQADKISASHVYLISGIFEMANEMTVNDLGVAGTGVKLTKRSSEENRLIIRSAPGHEAILDGVDNASYDRYGFFANWYEANTGDYITISSLTIRNVRGGLVHRYTGAEYPIVMNTNISNLDGPSGTNISGVAPWGVRSAIIFNNQINKSRVADEINQNGACIQSYVGINIFIQQNTLSDCYAAIYHKQSAQDENGDQYHSATVSRNFIKDVTAGIRFDVMGATGPGHSYTLTTQNIINHSRSGEAFTLAANATMILPAGHHNEFSHNLVDRRLVRSDRAYFSAKNHLNSSGYGNIVLDQVSSRYLHRFMFSAYAFPSDDELFDFIDLNIFVTDQGQETTFCKDGYSTCYNYETAKTWGIENNAIFLADHDLVSLPSTEENFSTGDFRIKPDSSWLTFAPGSIPAGPYITENEQIGFKSFDNTNQNP